MEDVSPVNTNKLDNTVLIKSWFLEVLARGRTGSVKYSQSSWPTNHNKHWCTADNTQYTQKLRKGKESWEQIRAQSLSPDTATHKYGNSSLDKIHPCFRPPKMVWTNHIHICSSASLFPLGHWESLETLTISDTDVLYRLPYHCICLC